MLCDDSQPDPEAGRDVGVAKPYLGAKKGSGPEARLLLAPPRYSPKAY